MATVTAMMMTTIIIIPVLIMVVRRFMREPQVVASLEEETETYDKDDTPNMPTHQGVLQGKDCFCVDGKASAISMS